MDKSIEQDSFGACKKECTVLMSDLRGFSLLSEDLDPHPLLEVTNHYLSEMTDIIMKYDGTILGITGDGILALFGDNMPCDHATEAIAAAIEMQDRMDEINIWNSERGLPTLKMGIGIDTGEVIVGYIGSEKWMSYNAIGSTVNICSRIESYTAGTQILISERTKEKAQAELTFFQDFVVFPKGLKKPLRLYHVTGMNSPYTLSCEFEREEPVRLPKPIPVSFAVVKDKQVDMVQQRGLLIALSKTGALLRTNGHLRIYDNLRVDICGQIFCKVGELKGYDRYINFMGIPEKFDEWYDSQWNER